MGNHVPVGDYPYLLRLAGPRDLHNVCALASEASYWLQTSKDTDQWARPWPSPEARDQRIRVGLETGKTWIVWNHDIPVATVTVATRPNPAVWSAPSRECDLSEPAVYAHRLITARDYAGQGIGAELIDWVGLQGRRQYGANWIRIDVWSSNLALHDYYRGQGFRRCGTCADPDYPSGALFQKPVYMIKKPLFPKFVLIPGFVVVSSNLDLAACLSWPPMLAKWLCFAYHPSAVMLMISESGPPPYLPEGDPAVMSSAFPAVPAGWAEKRRKDVFGDTWTERGRQASLRHVLGWGIRIAPVESRHRPCDRAVTAQQGGVMANRHCRPSTQYWSEHYDLRW